MQDTPENAYNAGYGWVEESRGKAMDYTSPNDAGHFPKNQQSWYAGLNNAQIEAGLHNLNGGNRVRKSSRRKSRKSRKTKRRKSYRR